MAVLSLTDRKLKSPAPPLWNWTSSIIDGTVNVTNYIGILTAEVRCAISIDVILASDLFQG